MRKQLRCHNIPFPLTSPHTIGSPAAGGARAAGGLEDAGGAYEHFEAAAAAGDEFAAFNLGFMHLKGLSVPQVYTPAPHAIGSRVRRLQPRLYAPLEWGYLS
eukprot:5005937-Pyramimonas_sp.AAC.1